MALSPGEKLGPYEILAPIGAGGMGEVYRAHDSRLNRDVAIKVSQTQFSERFEREARAIAALNHPNICQVYDVGASPSGLGYLVMELIEGESPKGPLPLDTALSYARQIAAGLQEAHDRGIVHRDLKPGNIKIKPDGTVKVLDFGLAKVASNQPAAPLSENSPTLSMVATQAGVVLGTASYMAPEQAKGKPVDRRADIWAFGVVLYEMLTGKRLFDGEDLTEVLASVVKEQPDLTAVPQPARRVIEACLQKDPVKRLQAIGDLRLLLEEAPATAPSGRGSESGLRFAAWSAAGVFALALGGLAFVHLREASPVEHHLRYTVAAPENSQVHSFAVSPDGRYLVIAASVNGKRQLWLRPLDALQAQPMPFTEDAVYPFWSPDSRFIGFFAQGKLKKVAASGGPSQSLCDVPSPRGGAWSRDDVIVFSPNGTSNATLQRVPAAGGVPSDIRKTTGDFRHPVFLPDGRRFLYMARQSTPEKNGIYVASLDGKENRRILADVSGMAYAPPAPGARAGNILFIRENTLMAIPFDAASAQVVGDVFPVADGVSISTNASYAPVTVSDNGVLLYATGGAAGGTNQIAWYDRSGKLLGAVGAPGEVGDPAISPDEKTVAFRRISPTGGDLWLRDLSRGTEQRFTTDPSTNAAPFWSPKGDRIVFVSNRGGVGNLYWKASSGSGADELLLAGNVKLPSQWSRDGRFVVYREDDPKTRWDIWVLPVDGSAAERKPIPFLQTEFNEGFGQLSPDSHWMAYTSDKSGRNEVYVRPFPPGEGEWPISVAGGEQARWRDDGKELFFEAADGKMMAVPVLKAVSGPKPSFVAGAPVPLFEAHMTSATNDVLFEYDVAADGKRFLIDTTNGQGAASAPPLTVVLNWQGEAKK